MQLISFYTNNGNEMPIFRLENSYTYITLLIKRVHHINIINCSIIPNFGLIDPSDLWLFCVCITSVKNSHEECHTFKLQISDATLKSSHTKIMMASIIHLNRPCFWGCEIFLMYYTIQIDVNLNFHVLGNKHIVRRL